MSIIEDVRDAWLSLNKNALPFDWYALLFYYYRKLNEIK
jgi:hypothetical protein